MTITLSHLVRVIVRAQVNSNHDLPCHSVEVNFTKRADSIVGPRTPRFHYMQSAPARSTRTFFRTPVSSARFLLAASSLALVLCCGEEADSETASAQDDI